MRGIYQLTPFMSIPECNEEYKPELRANIPCDDFGRKIIALRVYFVFIIINFLFVTSTTAYFIYRNVSAKWYSPVPNSISTSNQDISKQWRLYSLKKRGLFGSVLGAVGHLIFSSSVLLYQTFVTRFTCDIFLWGPVVGFYIWTYAIVWRALCLHFLIRLSELQQKYARQQKENHAIPEKDFLWLHKGSVIVKTSTQMCIIGASLFIITLIIALAETMGIWIDGHSKCEFYMGNYMVLAMVVFFFSIVTPLIFWYLRNDEDTHGIRKDIWVTVAVGIICFVICIIWQVLFEYPSDSKPAGLRGVFGPSNWLIIVTTTYHIMSVVMPVFRTLTIKGVSEKHTKKTFNKRGRQRRSSAISHISHAISIHASHRIRSSITLHDSAVINNHNWELTIESLYLALGDPAALAILKDWAVKDFSVENILFYEQYLQLVNMMSRSNRQQHRNSFSTDNETIHPQERIYPSGEGIDKRSSIITHASSEILSKPFYTHQRHELIGFYNTFIAENSPLQVNISYKARHAVDIVLQPIIQQYNTQATSIPRVGRPRISSFLQRPPQGNKDGDLNSSDFYDVVSTSLSTIYLTPSRCEKEEVLHQTNLDYSATMDVALSVLETARKEVFWNIYSGLFPKVVEAYTSYD